MKKPLNLAAWSGIISLILSLLIWFYILAVNQEGPQFILSLFGIIGNALSILFMHGFVVLGKKMKSKLLVVMSWIGIAFMIVLLVFGLIGSIVGLTDNVSAQEFAADKTDALIVLLVLWAFISLLLGAYSVLFGVGLLQISKKVRYAKTSAILEIVAGATYIILVGLFVKLVAYFFEIALLFEASKKFEK